MSKLLVMILGLACAASLAAAEGQPRKVWTARDVIIASGGTPPDDVPAVQATPGEPAAPAAAPAKAKKKSKARAAPKAKKKAAVKGAKKPRAKARR